MEENEVASPEIATPMQDEKKPKLEVNASQPEDPRIAVNTSSYIILY